MIVLVDMDGVIADFEKGFLGKWCTLHPDFEYIPLEKRTQFYIIKQYPAELRHYIWNIFNAENFFRDLPPIEGALEALQDMLNAGIDVFLCSTPLSSSVYSPGEKYAWVRHHLGNEWVQRVTLAKDKTLVYGDYLIDDRPEIHGIRVPDWQHVLYDQPYNRSQPDKLRITWANWQDVIK